MTEAVNTEFDWLVPRHQVWGTAHWTRPTLVQCAVDTDEKVGNLFIPNLVFAEKNMQGNWWGFASVFTCIPCIDTAIFIERPLTCINMFSCLWKNFNFEKKKNELYRVTWNRGHYTRQSLGCWRRSRPERPQSPWLNLLTIPSWETWRVNKAKLL